MNNDTSKASARVGEMRVHSHRLWSQLENLVYTLEFHLPVIEEAVADLGGQPIKKAVERIREVLDRLETE